MKAEVYAVKFKELQVQRGKEPEGWWLTPDHEINMTKALLKEVYDEKFDDYNRELQYQQGLDKITKARLRHALPYKVGQKAKIPNLHSLEGKVYFRHVETRNKSEILNVVITGEANITYTGYITFSVKFVYDKDEYMTKIKGELTEVVEGSWSVHQEDIISVEELGSDKQLTPTEEKEKQTRKYYAVREVLEGFRNRYFNMDNAVAKLEAIYQPEKPSDSEPIVPSNCPIMPLKQKEAEFIKKYATVIDIADITHVEKIPNRIIKILIEKDISPLVEASDIKAMNLANEQHWFDILKGKAEPEVFGDKGCLFQIAKWLDVELCDIYGMCFKKSNGNDDADCGDCKSQERWCNNIKTN